MYSIERRGLSAVSVLRPTSGSLAGGQLAVY
jgi:hypothetical protein